VLPPRNGAPTLSLLFLSRHEKSHPSVEWKISYRKWGVRFFSFFGTILFAVLSCPSPVVVQGGVIIFFLGKNATRSPERALFLSGFTSGSGKVWKAFLQGRRAVFSPFSDFSTFPPLFALHSFVSTEETRPGREGVPFI